MADFEEDTRLTGTGGSYTATLAPAWEGFNGIPIGGYLATLALRAAGRACGLPRPVSFHCQFIRAVKYGTDVELQVHALRATSKTAALRVSLLQSSEVMLEALVWASGSDLPGYDFSASEPPIAAAPNDWQSIEGRTNQPLPKCMDALETRWDHADPGSPGAHTEPHSYAWHRFKPRDRFDDPFADASRLLFLADLRAFGPVPYRAGVAPMRIPFFAPNIDLTVQFCRPSSGAGWLFGAARALDAAQGTIATRIDFWSERGDVLAVASSTLMCRANPFAG